MKAVIVLLSFTVAVSLSISEDSSTEELRIPPELVKLNDSYAQVRLKIREPIQSLTDQYLNRLGELKKSFQAQSNLDAVLFIDGEFTEIRKTNAPIENPSPEEPAELVSARRIYLTKLREVEIQAQRNLKPKQDLYIGEMIRMEEMLTAQGRTQEAVAVRTIREEVDIIEVTPLSSGRPTIKKELLLKVQVDGLTHLYLRGDTLWFDHTRGRAHPPGLHEGIFPTYIDRTIEWLPVWEDSVTQALAYSTGLPVDGIAPEIRVRSGAGRGVAEVIQQPEEMNDYTTIIEFRDETRGGKRFGGSDWLEIKIYW